MKKSTVVTKNLTYSYISDEEAVKFALNGVDVVIEKGEFVVILGHNGSGKSTFAKLLNALYTPTDGDVLVDGMSTRDESKVWDIRKTCGMVFQNPDNQLVATLVEEDVAFGPENLGIPSAEIVTRVKDALETVGLSGFDRRAPHMLSGGQKQRVAIAGILAMLPDVIVFDEPTAMLDPQGRTEVLKTIHKLNKEQGKTIIYITHYIEEAIEADRIMVLGGGRLILDGTPREVFSEYDLLKEAGLSVPRAAKLYYMLKENGIDLGDLPVTNAQLVEGLCRLL
ncbi:MAG: energy-coupling factor transporter ATPase [Eubacteriales bacterium]